MKRILIASAVVAAACAVSVPAVAGLANNQSFSHRLPVHVPSQARLVQVDNHGGVVVAKHGSDDPTATRVPSVHTSTGSEPEPGDDHGGTDVRTTEPGDDNGSVTETEPGDDNGSVTETESGDDNGGASATATERGDDNGGASATASATAPEPGDDNGGASATATEPGDDNGGATESGDDHSGSGRHGG